MPKRILKLITALYVIFVILLSLIFNLSNIKPYFWNGTKLNGFDKRVQIWSKAAIGDYLWGHILNGTVTKINNGFYRNGNVTIGEITFEYFSGPGYIQTTVPQNVKHLLLVLNGRTFEHTIKGREWLDYLPKLNSLNNLAVVLLGNENCEDDWILKYMKSKGGIIDVLFVVYDSPLVDNKEIYQWPLGVATYRGFPNVNSNINLNSSRKYLCNFMGTVYHNSSRQRLVEMMSQSNFKDICYLESREKWLPKETAQSLNKYIHVLSKSVITFSPAGMNPECYRLYEAISLGSIPAVVMEQTHGNCVNPPLRLLLHHNVPIIKFSSWEEALRIITSSHLNLPHTSTQLISWYANFKSKLALQLVEIIHQKFF